MKREWQFGLWWALGLWLFGFQLAAYGQENKTHLPIRDLASIEGVRENPLIGYGMVVGLAGTGDRRQTMFSTQTLANILQKMGVQIPAASVSVKNIAAVFVTASLPPFARPGSQIDGADGFFHWRRYQPRKVGPCYWSRSMPPTDRFMPKPRER